MIVRTSVALGCSALLSAQTTWIVNASGGVGVHFSDLASAVANAVDGDTILCQTPTFGESLGGFTTNKALTIVGDANGVPLTTLGVPIQIVGLPAGKTFRMAGFQAVIDGELRIGLQNCAGRVELDNLQAREPDLFFPTAPAIDISNCASVAMRDIVDFGLPAVRVQSSRVLLTCCRLGITRINLGGGPCLWATNADIDIVQPEFQTAGLGPASGGGYAAIFATNSVLRVGGDHQALVSGGPPLSASGGSAIVANGGTVTIDPAVALAAGTGSPLIAGSATLVTAPVVGTWITTPSQAGQPLALRTTAPSASIVWQALGLPAAITATPWGTLGIDVAAGPAFFPPLVATGAGVANQLVVPPSLPRGQAFASQAVVWDGGTLSFGAPVVFVVQ